MAEASSPGSSLAGIQGESMAEASSPGSSLAGIQGESSTRKLAADILVESFRVVFHQDSRIENFSGAL